MREGGRTISGRNAVSEALRSGETIDKVVVLKGGRARELGEIVNLARARGVPIHLADKPALERLAGHKAHQGVVAVGARVRYATFEEFLRILDQAVDPPLVVILDGITDPHNMGAVIRSVDGAGAHGVVIAKRRAAGLGEGIVKSSAGAVFHVPIVRVPNLSRTIEALKQRGVWVYGIDPNGEKVYYELDMVGPVSFVVGGEHTGLSRLVRERCDGLVRIPMHGKVSSLNASVSASIILFEARRQRATAVRHLEKTGQA